MQGSIQGSLDVEAQARRHQYENHPDQDEHDPNQVEKDPGPNLGPNREEKDPNHSKLD